MVLFDLSRGMGVEEWEEGMGEWRGCWSSRAIYYVPIYYVPSSPLTHPHRRTRTAHHDRQSPYSSPSRHSPSLSHGHGTPSKVAPTQLSKSAIYMICTYLITHIFILLSTPPYLVQSNSAPTSTIPNLTLITAIHTPPPQP